MLEKGPEVGAHTLSGAVIETSALDELFPDWKDSAPVFQKVLVSFGFSSLSIFHLILNFRFFFGKRYIYYVKIGYCLCGLVIVFLIKIKE